MPASEQALQGLLPDHDAVLASLCEEHDADLPIVAGYVIDRHRRAGRCEAIAERGRHAALARQD